MHTRLQCFAILLNRNYIHSTGIRTLKNLRFDPCALYQGFKQFKYLVKYLQTTICTTLPRTYPCIAFRGHRVGHPGAEPGSRRLDGYGVADARQFATCWKERSETGISRTMSVWVFTTITSLVSQV